MTLQQHASKTPNTFGSRPLRKIKNNKQRTISDLKYTDSHGNLHAASADDSKAEALCNFFSRVFNNEDDNPFKYLEKKTL